METNTIPHFPVTKNAVKATEDIFGPNIDVKI